MGKGVGWVGRRYVCRRWGGRQKLEKMWREDLGRARLRHFMQGK